MICARSFVHRRVLPLWPPLWRVRQTSQQQQANRRVVGLAFALAQRVGLHSGGFGNCVKPKVPLPPIEWAARRDRVEPGSAAVLTLSLSSIDSGAVRLVEVAPAEVDGHSGR
jgi:hypothetical protein